MFIENTISHNNLEERLRPYATSRNKNSIWRLEVRPNEEPAKEGFFDGFNGFRNGDYVTWKWANFFQVSISPEGKINLIDVGGTPP